MIRIFLLSTVSFFIFFLSLNNAAGNAEPEWSANLTVFETCSCPVFCQCFFTGKPPADCCVPEHMADKAFCRFNQAYKVNTGHFGNVKLDGVNSGLQGMREKILHFLN